MVLNKFQKDVVDYLFDKLDSVWYGSDASFHSVSEMVDAVFEEDKASNMPLAGNTIQDVTAYVDANRIDIANSLNEYKQREGLPVMSAEEYLENPNGFLIEAFIAEGKNMLSKSSLQEVLLDASDKETEFVLDKQNICTALNVLDNIEKYLDSDKENKESLQLEKDCAVLTKLDYHKIADKTFENLNDLVVCLATDYDKRVEIKDVLKDTHIARMTNFKADETFIDDIKELSNPSALKEDREQMSVRGENEFLNSVYTVYQRESFYLPFVLQNKNLVEFKNEIYDNSVYTERRNNKYTKKMGNAILKDILPVTMYRKYEKFKGIPLDARAKILRHSNGTTYECEIGKILKLTDTCYHGVDKMRVNTFIDKAVVGFKAMNLSPKDYLLSQSKSMSSDLTADGRKLLENVALNCFSKYRSRMMSREPANKIEKNDSFGR